jgi:hypothetical protein
MSRCQNLQSIPVERVDDARKINSVIACVGSSCSKKRDRFEIDTICYQKGE